MISTIAEKMPLISRVTGAVGSFLDGVQSAVDSITSAIQSALGWLSGVGERQAKVESQYNGSITYGPKKKAVGMPYVPKDDYPVLLHKGERVLTAQQNRQYNNGSGAGTVNIPKLADTIVIREDMDIDRTVTQLVKKLKSSMQTYGGAF